MSYTVIDDRDSTVTYTGTWVVGGTTHEHSGTVSSSVNVGDHFSVPFTGTSIGVYGTYDADSAGVHTSYAIDGGSATTVTSTASSNGQDDYQQLFWQSSTISNGSHTLVVTMESVNTGDGDGEGTIWFDFFNVTVAAASTLSSAGVSSSGSSSSTSTTATKSAHASSTSSASTAVVSKKSSHSSLIGGITVAVVVLILCMLVLLRRRRQQQNSNFRPAGISAASGPPPSQPFLPNPTPLTPMMGNFAGSPSVSGAPYANPAPARPATYGVGPGGFDPRIANRASYNPAYAPVSPQGQAHDQAYEPYAAIGADMQQSPYNSHPSSPSVSSVPSSRYQNRGPLTVVGSSSTADGYSDSIADLKRRQQEVVASYEHGVSGAPIQHVDSGIRSLDEPGPSELPPVYTPN
ncbi:hypothetical protein DFH07DRAFT_971754 [Mycena maculata]|uniref:Transmembrane protein n=1 Tax=Mycena maculata TaxID=230809 RepID=A0AAD7HKW3_9AGAR|nr:hypothetical protein DFH07DRAFT_971754 [Mycena maculata]